MRKIIIDQEKCVGCADCALTCPVSIYTFSPPPCQTACPINTDVFGYVSLIEQGKFDDALASIRQINPFPGITGRVCTHPCEKECLRGKIDEPVAICALKRAATQYGQVFKQGKPSTTEGRGERVAIVGSGPAGLMAAHTLAWLGYIVTIFESLPVAGGMLVVGIPEYRLPRKIVEAEIGQIEELGVQFRLNTKIGKDITLNDLFKQGYRAILLATGAHKSLKLEIPGEDQFEGVLDAVSLLQEINLGRTKKVAGRAIIVGGGNAAVDAARSLLRLGCTEVNVVYRRTRKEMPAIESEVIEAECEGVKINYLVAPTAVLGKDGKVTGLQCIHTELGEPDASGRARAVPIKGSEFSMEAELIISAIGQKPDLLFQQGSNLAVSTEGLVSADLETMATKLPRIFAAGDVVSGPASVIDALAAGRRAAVSIHRYLEGEDLRRADKEKTKARVVGESEKWWMGTPKSRRQRMRRLSMKECHLNFGEVELGLTQSSAVEEARRCLGCAIFAYIDSASCLGETCKLCANTCWKYAISIETKGQKARSKRKG